MRPHSALLVLLAASSVTVAAPSAGYTPLEAILIEVIQKNGWSDEECADRLFEYFSTRDFQRNVFLASRLGNRSDVAFPKDYFFAAYICALANDPLLDLDP